MLGQKTMKRARDMQESISAPAYRNGKTDPLGPNRASTDPL
jgi:hypothetical protein